MDAEQIKKLVAAYQPNQEVLQAMSQIKILGTVGPSASGKTTLMNRLVSGSSEFKMVVDETTRLRRPDEIDGVDYIFRSREEVLADMQAGRLLQVALGPNGDFYETRPQSYTPNAIDLVALVPAAVIELRRLPVKSFQAAYIVPADFEAWRGWFNAQAAESVWTPEQRAARLAEAQKSYEFALSDTGLSLVLNDDIDRAVERLRQVGQGQTPDDQDRARQLVQENLQKLKNL